MIVLLYFLVKWEILFWLQTGRFRAKHWFQWMRNIIMEKLNANYSLISFKSIDKI